MVGAAETDMKTPTWLMTFPLIDLLDGTRRIFQFKWRKENQTPANTCWSKSLHWIRRDSEPKL